MSKYQDSDLCRRLDQSSRENLKGSRRTTSYFVAKSHKRIFRAVIAPPIRHGSPSPSAFDVFDAGRHLKTDSRETVRRLSAHPDAVWEMLLCIFLIGYRLRRFQWMRARPPSEETDKQKSGEEEGHHRRVSTGLTLSTQYKKARIGEWPDASTISKWAASADNRKGTLLHTYY